MPDSPALLTRPGKEERALRKLSKLLSRRRYHEWRLREVETNIGAATRELAQARGVAFIRREDAEQQVAAHEAGLREAEA